MDDGEIIKKIALNEEFVKCGDIRMSAIYGYLEKTNKNYKFSDMHTHPAYEMHIVMNGSSEIKINDDIYTLAQNDVIIIPPNTKHCIINVSSVKFMDMTIMFTIIRRTGDHVKMYDLVMNSLKKRGEGKMFFSPEIAYNAMKIYKLHSQSETNDFRAMNINCLMQSIALYVFDILTPKKNRKMEEFISNEPYFPKNTYVVKEIDEYISRYTKPISVNGLAEYINVSKRSAQRIFKNIYGMNFTEKLTELRLNKAAELITETDYSIEEISSEVGYLTYSAFRKAFLNYFGVSPKNYRKTKENFIK